jgi:ketosteroid isomerase-like protein
MRLTARQLSAGITALCLACIALSAPTATPTATELRNQILALDKAFFDAFNTCDLETWRRHLAEDVEFYQDNDEVTTSRDALERSFKARCGTNNVAKLRRELLPDTVEVHPIQGFGAVQFGTHQFWKVTAGEPDQLMATPKFVHLWRHKDGVWQMTRVISYGH